LHQACAEHLEDIEVPLKAGKSSQPPRPRSQMVCCTTLTPGAAMSTPSPRELNHASPSF
jgi:hypothetical protein